MPELNNQLLGFLKILRNRGALSLFQEIKDNYFFCIPFTVKLLEKTKHLPKTVSGKNFLDSLLEFINENINEIELNIRMIAYDLLDLYKIVNSKGSIHTKKS